MASRPIQEPGAIRAVLDAAEVVDAGGLLDRAPERLEDLRAAVSAFLEARFDAAHAQDYSRRVGLLGYRFIDPDEFVRRYGDAQRIADRFAAGTVERGALYSALWDNPEVRTATPTRL